MMNTIKKLITQTGISAKVMIPIIVVSMLSIIVGAKIIGDSLEEQIVKSSKQEIRNLGNKIYFSIRSDYKTLFFNFGQDKEHYSLASVAAQKESVNHLKQLLNDYDNVVLLKTPAKVFELTSHHLNIDKIEHHLQELQDVKEVIDADDYFFYKRTFLPWNWELVIVKDKNSLLKIIQSNQNLVILNISVLVIIVLLLLRYVLQVTINQPFETIFHHLKRISQGEYTTLNLPLSKEIHLLTRHINSMAKSIQNREEELILEQKRTKNILDSQLAIVIVSDGEHILDTNEAFFAFFTQYKTLEEFVEEHDCVCDFFLETDEEDYIYKSEKYYWVDEILSSARLNKVKMMKDEELYIFSITINYYKDRSTQRYVISLADITQLELYKKEVEAKKDDLVKQLYTDSLTGLPNRLQLVEDITHNDIASLVLLDINAFKEINDFFGHEIGDAVLKEFGQKVQNNTMFKGYKLYRLSGDEFALYKAGSSFKDKCTEYVHSLSNYLNDQTYMIQNHNIVFTTTVGSAINANRTSLFIYADIALKTAKQRKKQVVIYDESLAMLQEFAVNLEWVNKLKKAFEDDRIIPYFQPIVNNQTQKIEKFESLVRMRSTNGEIIVPYFFLDVAKKSYQYSRLTEIMIDKSFHYFQKLPHKFSLNLSSSDIFDKEIVELLFQKIQQYDIGHKLIIELLESEGFENYDVIAKFIADIKDLGCQVAIDDFGAGFSNFERVIRLNIDYLKIDGSLIQNILEDQNAQIIVETIAEFSKRLGIKTIAEFVENEEVFKKVKSLGIDYSQGYYFSKPIPKEDVIKLMKEIKSV